MRTNRDGDFEAAALAAAMMDRPSITGDAVDHYRRIAPGRPAVAFCVSVRHAEATAAAFRAAGWRAAAASGATPAGARDAAIGGLADGAVQVLCACDLISEGLDVPAIGAAILLRPTQSLGLHLQQVGRRLRPAPGKRDLVVLDHAGNTLRHGLPEDEREWTLEGRARRDRKDAPAVRQCPTCWAMHRPAPACPQCGFAYGAAAEEGGARAPAQRDGELVEIDPARRDWLRRRPLDELLRHCRTRAEVEEVRVAKGYREAWADHAWREQQEARDRNRALAAQGRRVA